jgi:hypothetical protein
MRLQVANRSQNVVLKGRNIEVSLAGTDGAAESTEIDCQNPKSFGHQSSSLNPPAFLVESATVSEQNRAGPPAIEIGAYPSAVFGGERDRLLCGGYRGNDKSQAGAGTFLRK